tara:strand:+ start:3418 stop:5217 length:1800 start_codon:yes stop_codon:yes gene_type:complete
MLSIYQKLTKIFENTLKESLEINQKNNLYNKLSLNLITQSSREDLGDYQSNICMILSKIYEKNPHQIAEEFISLIEKNKNIFKICSSLDIAGPGFINIKLSENILLEELIKNTKCPRNGISLVDKENKKIVIDFSSPNIAKEMHVGHLRSTIIGDSLARVFEIRGYEVIRLNHVGDWGTQFGMLITHLKDVYPEALESRANINIGDLVEFYKASKKRFDNEEEFQKKARAEVVRLQKGDPSSISAWRILCSESRKEFNSIYSTLNIQINERGESFYNPYLESVVKELELKNISVEDQGAKCVFLDGMSNKEGDKLPLIIQKKDGGFNYATTDLAALKYRFSEPPNGDGAGRIIYVTDQGQSNHFAGVFQVAKKAKWIPENCSVEHVPFGLVQGIDGKKLKTREGETIKLKDLLKESVKRAKKDLINRISEEQRTENDNFIANTSNVIGIGSVKYADLSQNRITNYQFSFDKMLAMNGNTAPYILYSLVRISGIKRKIKNARKEEINEKIYFNEDSEWNLIKKLLRFDEVIMSIEKDLMPNRLCNYLFELCQIFNRFYDQLPILKAEPKTMNSRMVLCTLTEKTLRLSLYLLGIETLERM